ncbi:hypothetical protein C4D60_Mb05t17850 [Musa balbisiana]|uniref:40S ribosomal protein S14 n=1 Tax=Musa balbisiana TaxID=52838 RepID=A0A4S8JWX8_MUSBA|nr:hypothetical protein C4D60_Mb05t17850 [Musa balbisiana]
MLYLVCCLIYNLVCRLLGTDLQSGRRKTREPKEDNVTLGPAVREGEQVFGVAHIFASFNDTCIHVTDLSGRETLVRITVADEFATSRLRYDLDVVQFDIVESLLDRQMRRVLALLEVLPQGDCLDVT